MNESTINFLQQMAQKLGTTVDHVYSVLLAQAPLHGTTVCLGFVLVTGLLWGAQTVIKKFIKSQYEAPSQERAEAVFAQRIIFAFCWFIFFFIAVTKILTVVTCFFNPEYWVLQQLRIVR